MKPLTSLFLSLALILAPVLAVSKKTQGMSEAEFDAKCKAEGGCFIVSENGFKLAMVIAFNKGQALGQRECRGSM